MYAAELLAAFALDFVLGDPRGFPHPVRLLGAVLNRAGNLARRRIPDPFLAGLVATCVTLCAAAALVAGTIILANAFWPGLGRVARIVWLYLGLATRSLDREARAVLHHLEAGDTAKAREALAGIVGRNTTELTEPDIVTATIETVAENTVDGVLAPAFYALIGGPVLMWIFKAISTADSMIGHRTFRSFGRFAARLDDAANFLPARACFLLFPVASTFTGFDGAAALHVMRRDHARHDSPNAGIPEAAMAGALHARLGGTAVYGETMASKGPFGSEFPPPAQAQVEGALSIMWTVSLLGLIAGALLRAGLTGQG